MIKEVEEETKVSQFTSFEYFGIQQGESNMLLALLETKFGSVPDNYIKKIQSANPNILLVWGKRMVTANSLHEIFNG